MSEEKQITHNLQLQMRREKAYLCKDEINLKRRANYCKKKIMKNIMQLTPYTKKDIQYKITVMINNIKYFQQVEDYPHKEIYTALYLIGDNVPVKIIESPEEILNLL